MNNKTKNLHKHLSDFLVEKNLLTKTVQDFSQKRIYTFANLKNKTFSSILKKEKERKKKRPSKIKR